MDTNYLEEAFKRLSLLEDDFDISVDADKVDELRSFIEDDVDEVPEEEIIDVKADDETELQDNYVGKVILECECCHTRIYKDKEEVFIDEESGLANINEPCPVCNNELGYTVIGKIEPFDSDKEINPEEDEVEITPDDIEVEDEVEITPDDVTEGEEVEVEESLENRINRKHLHENKDGVCPHCGKNPCECESLEECDSLEEEFEDPSKVGVDSDVSVEDDIKLETPQDNPVNEDPSVLDLKEDFKEVEIKTDDQKLEMTSDENGKVTVTTEPLEEEVAEDEVVDSITTEPDDAEVGPEEIVPLDSEEEIAIENNVPEDEQEEEIPEEAVEDEVISSEEPIEDNGEEEDEDELDIEDFDEESFDDMGESYMRKVYSNVTGYKTTKINESNGSLLVDGVITFGSGVEKNTQFVFENATLSRRGKLILEGYNKTFSDAKKSFIIRGLLEGKKYIPESFIYNYKVKQLNESTNSNETVRVFGRIKKR